MKKTARVIVTFECNRKCPGCCNNQLPYHTEIYSDYELMKYQEIVITGGEPLMIPDKVMDFVTRMRKSGYLGKIYMYSSFWNGDIASVYVLKNLNGITFTLHAECTDVDIIALKNLSRSLKLQKKEFSRRLIVDKRVYDRYDLSNIDFGEWDVIRKLEWKDICDPASNEELLVYKLS